MENKILNLLKKIIKEDEDTFIDITDMDDDSAAETVISKKDIFKKLKDKMSDKMSDKKRTPGGFEYGEIVSGEMGEELHGGQSKIDVASPKGKITADDFKKLRDGKKSNKSEVGENIFKKMFGKKEDPEVAREKDRKENPYLGNLGYDYDDIRGWHYVGPGQGRFDKDSEDGEIEEGMHGGQSKRGDSKTFVSEQTKDGQTYSIQKIPSGKFKIFVTNASYETPTDASTVFGVGSMWKEYSTQDEAQKVIDGVVNTDMIKSGIKEGMYGSFDDEHGWYDKDDRQHTGDFDFDFDEEEFSDFDSLMNKHGKNQRWFGKDGKMYFDKYQEKFDGKPFRVRTRKNEMGEGNAFSKALEIARKNDKPSFEVDGKTYPVKESIQLTEDELIDLIEKIVNEQTTVPVTNKSLKSSKTENDDYIKSVTKKMQTYLKDASKGKYDANPTQFPKGNGELAKMAKKAYTPSSAVEEYIENFAYSPGMENLQYDEIKPNEDWLEANIEGSSKTGNGAGGNAIDTGLGKKINARRKKNLYGAEKNKSYNRVPQPIDQAGEETHNNTLDSMFKKLGESEDKKSKLINEEMDKMKHLLGYKKKTQ